MSQVLLARAPRAIRPYPARVIRQILNVEVRTVTILMLAVIVVILVCLAWPVADAPKKSGASSARPNRSGQRQDTSSSSNAGAELDTMDLLNGGDLLGKLSGSMPELQPQVLNTAYALARRGASTDDLIRILGVTRRQAVTIITNIRVR
jgi:hypothetical protein